MLLLFVQVVLHVPWHLIVCFSALFMQGFKVIEVIVDVENCLQVRYLLCFRNLLLLILGDQ